MSTFTASFTVANIKTDKNGMPYLTLYSKEVPSLFKVSGLQAAMLMSKTVGADGNGIAQGDLLNIDFASSYENNWTAPDGTVVKQNALRGVTGAVIKARKGSGVQVRGGVQLEMKADKAPIMRASVKPEFKADTDELPFC